MEKHKKAQASRNTRFAIILMLPFLIAIIVSSLWAWLLYNNNINFSEEASTPFLYMIMPLVGFVYVIFAGMAVTASLNRYKRLMRSVVRKDVSTYLEDRDQPLPFLLRGLVAIPSLVLMFLALLFKYADFPGGFASVFIVTVLVSLTWLVIVELDTVHHRRYFKNDIPQHWHKKSAQDYFTSDETQSQ